MYCYNYKVTCPHCKDSVKVFDMPQTIEEMKEKRVTGKCWNCHKVFFMIDAISDSIPHVTNQQ